MTQASFVVGGAQAISLSQMFTIPASASNPAYMVLNLLDRNEYTAGESGATGTLSGNGHTLGLTSIGSDGRGADIVFTYQASSGRYLSSTYGFLDQVSYTSSASRDDVTSISLFGTSNLAQANAYGKDAYAMTQVDAAGYAGSVTVATQPTFTGSVPSQATPASIAAAAMGFVGHAWNENGCWVLASTIAAEAGASLPITSTSIGVPGLASGEWIIAYNGPAGSSSNWQSIVHAGEIVAFSPGGTGGHITTVVSGYGATAMLVDNITYVDSAGKVANSANDGSANDIVIAAPHLASQEWAGVPSSSVVIYELDTPIVANLVASYKAAFGSATQFSSLFSAADPGTRHVTSYQVYDTTVSDVLQINGSTVSAHSAATAATVASLASAVLWDQTTTGSDTLAVRAFNGVYWGDWQSLQVTMAGPGTVSAPTVTSHTADQTWNAGQHVSLALAANTFTDPQGQALTYTASLASGLALPSWLTFNAATETFSGTAPALAQSLYVNVSARDSSGLSVSETFAINVHAAAITVAHQTPNQQMSPGQNLNFTMASNTFSDPNGSLMTYTAAQTGGPDITAWEHFDSKTMTFSGHVPLNMSGTATIQVTAHDASGLSASETFTETFGNSAVKSFMFVTDMHQASLDHMLLFH